MKKIKSNLLGCIVAMLVCLVGSQNALAVCKGTVVFQVPDGWTQTYLYFANNAYQIKTAKAGEFVTIDLVGIGLAQGTQDSSFSFTNSTQVDYPLPYTVDTRGYDTLMSARSGTIPCPGDGSTSYVYQNPAVAGKTVVSSEPPNAKTIHVIVPVTDDWQAAVPMISLDGTYASAKMLSADPDRCGWYTYTFFDEPINDNLYLVRDDDTEMEEVIGDNGYSDEEDVSLTPIPLKSLFEIFEVNDLYFVPDRAQWEDFPELETYHGWMDHDAIELEGTCNYNLAAIIYDTDASLHGAFTCAVPWRSGITPDEEKGNGCKVAGAKYAFTTAVTPCVGVTQGMVEEELDATTKKPKLTAKGLKCFGGNAEAFEVMFKSTPGINELSCYDMPFERSDDGKWEFDSDNYKSAGVKAVGGFYPVETTTDATVEGTPTPAARTKRMAEGPVFYHSYLRQNDPKTGVPRIDIVCNGPGWNGGHDCEGEFQSGGDLDNPKAEGVANFLYSIYPQIGAEGAALRGANCWGDYCNADAPKGWPMFVKGTEDSLGTEPRWTSDPNGDSKGTGRNQHFCFESHANFKYRAGLKFTFRGDDDIWVYIGNKLAVDLGGTHLAAPAYVDLDYFGKKNGLEVGETYDLDIFFCDRRTTMSNVRIKTNMFIKQSSGLDYTPKTIASGEKEYRLCYTETGDNSCASFVAGSTGKTKKECGDSISVPIRYYITNKSGSFGPYELTEGDPAACGGIDLSHKGKPIIDKNKVGGCGMGPGSYKLVAQVASKSISFNFRVSGNLDVVNRDAITVNDEIDGYVPLNYHYTKSAMASVRVPILVTSVMDPGGNNPLELDVIGSVGQTYSLTATPGVSLYANKDDTTPLAPSDFPLQIDESGIDTVWATIESDFMTSPEQDVTIQVSGAGEKLVATIKFYAPKLVFVKGPESTEAISGDDPTNERWLGSTEEFYVMALAPVEGSDSWSLCKTCDFQILQGSQTSTGLNLSGTYNLVEGRATISVFADREYRYDPVNDNPAKLHITGPNPNLTAATYYPLHFKEPPVPYPVLVDVFDVRGAVSDFELNLKEPYFSASQEYLDGIADSVAIYYHRPFHKDSLPEEIYIWWANDYKTTDGADFKETNADTTGLVSFKPTKEEMLSQLKCGASQDFSKYCEGSIVHAYCEAATAADYCTPLLGFGGLTLSSKVKTGHTKTNGEKLISKASFKDKGNVVPYYGKQVITDRVAPIILSANVKTESDGSRYDQLRVVLSEPAQIRADASQFGKESFSFYLNSAADLALDARYKEGVAAQAAPAASDTIRVRFVNDDPLNPSPHVGDYIRFRADAVVWEDLASLATQLDSNSTMVDPSTYRDPLDAGMYWNSPTDYPAGKLRLPSPWVQVTGDAKISVKSIKISEIPPGTIIPSVTPVGQVIDFPSTKNFDEVKTELMQENGYLPLGHYITSDMGAILGSDTAFQNIDPATVYFYYEVDYFTNLGNYVAGQKGKIYCSDAKNAQEGIPQHFGGGNCTDPGQGKNFFIAWNMLSEDNRLVGSGAYVSKMNTYVKVGSKVKTAKRESTEMWGVKRGKGVLK